MDFTFNTETAPEKKPRGFDLIPAKTEAAACITDFKLRETNNGGTQLVLTFTIIEGPFSEPTARKVWQNVTLANPQSAQAVEIGHAWLKECCEALNFRGSLNVAALETLKEKPCRITIGIEKDKTGQYGDRNVVWDVKSYKKGGTPTPPPAQTPRSNGPTPQVVENHPSGLGDSNMDDIPF